MTGASPWEGEIRFLRACHEADGARAVVADAMKEARFAPWVLPGEDELTRGVLDRVPLVDAERLEAIERLGAMYQRERSLQLGAGVIAGRAEGRTWCAPLFVARATLERDAEGRAFARPLEDGWTVQAHVLAELGNVPESEVVAWAADLPRPPFDEVAVHTWSRTLGERLPGLDTTGFRDWPMGVDRAAVRSARKGKQLRLLPALWLCLVPTTRRGRGVLAELDEMASTSVSAPVAAVLSGEPAQGERRWASRPVPLICSDAQQRALDTAARGGLSTIIGPPGTGKSTTLAAVGASAVSAGRSVLMASRTPAALDALQSRLDALLGEPFPVLRISSSTRRSRLAESIDDLRRGALPFEGLANLSLDGARASLVLAQKELGRCVARMQRAVDAEHALHAPVGWEATRAWVMAWRGWQARRHAPLWDLADAYEAALDTWERAVRLVLKLHIRHGLEHARLHHAKAMKALAGAVRARTSSTRAKRLAAVDVRPALRLMPPWMVDVGHAHIALPLSRGLFDLAIVDEATHMDVASALPVLQRAESAVVTGDPKQLRHVSFLAREQERSLRREHGVEDVEGVPLAYRDESLLDRVERATEADALVMLDEHFRSRPHIIDFSNEAFYDRRLGVMTAHPGEASTPCVHVTTLGGRRNEEGVNVQEVEAVVASVVARVRGGDVGTVGVISPLRDQVEALRGALGSALTAEEMGRHEVMVDTPYGFQGLERDEVWLSFALDADAPSASWRYLDREDVFNVAITRARLAQHVFVSVVPESLPPTRLLRRYLVAVGGWMPTAGAAQATVPENHPVAVSLREAGFRVTAGFVVGGLVVDLVAERGGRAVAIDVVGARGGPGDALAGSRTRVLHRAGLRVVPVALSAWQADPKAGLQAIEVAWAQRAQA